MTPTILLTQGDINGIGTEIILKAFAKLRRLKARLCAVGSMREFEFHRKRLDLPVALAEIAALDELDSVPRSALAILNVKHEAKTKFGQVRADAGDLAMKSVELAARLCLRDEAHAIVTAPIHKEAIAKAGWAFEGHTDFLAHLSNRRVQMLFADERSQLRVALATVHVPLAKVSERLSTQGIEEKIQTLHDALRRDFGIKTPRIAVLGLNPHASDGGIIGREEEELLKPTLKRLARRFRLKGPFAADGFFGAKLYRNFDATLAMYHDQALIPFKMLAFETGVNLTLGLPFVRTSPDHGVAFDIAGKGIANESSFIEATKLALKLAIARRAAQTRSRVLA
ncbi:MAG: 4-hydroxythreonine-4-phosphate dehydrogenase PdxA [Chloroherpetonaceae bacterium]|nr:4-hydroxythreonine-4-phosphate dehydrogenase PdxA [Chloroherpetonaceae bacterium]MDW8437438.1 4-hydroxythreonine-4-phosphate dehydrogenase PdxA [Chloroherpetonaceae bacterium]